MPNKLHKDVWRGPDLLAVVLLGLLGVVGIGAIYGVVRAGYMTPGALAGVVVVGGSLAFIHRMGARPKPPQNTGVHGEARRATEAEAQTAARGAVKSRAVHEQQFPD